MAENEKRNERANEAVTVDWIVLTATAIALAVVFAASLQAGEKGLVANLASMVIARGT